MPLETSITKGNGHQLPLRWGWWHVSMMCEAAGVKSVFDFPSQGFIMPHDFSVCDTFDHEELVIKQGWKLEMWRST